MSTIDVHNHLFPAEWLDYIKRRTASPPAVHSSFRSKAFYLGSRPLNYVTKAGKYEPKARIEDMDRYGIDVQILSLSLPGVELVPKYPKGRVTRDMLVGNFISGGDGGESNSPSRRSCPEYATSLVSSLISPG